VSGKRTGILAAVVRLSLRFRGIVVVLAAMLMGYGIYSVGHARYDVFPEFTPPQVTIRAEAPGLSCEQVEMLVTTPMERAIAGITEVESFRSKSIAGLSAVTVIFRTDIHIYRVREIVAERLSSMTHPLPAGVTPFVSPLTSSTGTVLQLGLTSESRSLMEVRTMADWTIAPRLLGASGVAQVQIYGGEVRQLQIQVRPDRLVKYNLSIDDVLAAAGRATGIRGAGFIENANQRITLRTEGQSLTPVKLAETVLVHQDGGNVILGDVATVTNAPAPSIGAASINGRPGVILLITGQYGANTLDITSQLDEAVKELQPMLQKEDIVLHTDLFRPARYIHTALHNVERALEMGAILVIAILVLFLFNWRTAAISAVAIPLSLLSSVIVLGYMGLSLDIMTMGGLAVAIGEVVDDAVVDVENILRRLRENRQAQSPKPALAVILNASIEVRGAVLYATLAVVLVFLPVLVLTGVAGRLFSPLGISYIVAVLSSLVVALTVTPALCSLLLRTDSLGIKEPPVARVLKEAYGKILKRVNRHPLVVIAAAAVFVAAGLSALFFLHEEFLPQLREGNAIVHVTTAPGTSLTESLRLGDRISRDLLTFPQAGNVSQKTGRAEEGSSTRGIDSSEIDVTFESAGGQPGAYSAEAVRALLAQYPGVSYEVNTFLKERIGETISGYTASVAVNIFSHDLENLTTTGQSVAMLLQTVPGATDVVMQSRPSSPEVRIEVRRNDLQRWGFDSVTVLDAIRTAYQGSIVARLYDQDRIFDVAVILSPENRRSPHDIGELPIRSASGTYLPLRAVADISQSTGLYTILHNNGRRVQTITCNVQGRDVSNFTAEAQKKISSAKLLPAGTYIEFAGTAQAAAQARNTLLTHSIYAGLGIILLLFIVLRHYRNVLLVLLNLPFALVGCVLILLFSGTLLSLGAMVGFVTVFGITLRNSIMMISHYEHLVSSEGVSWSPQTATRGASERLSPILMTALVTGFGLLPLALTVTVPGREIEGHMAIVILGGLFTSTALNLLVLPPLALRYGRFGGSSIQD
jgi:CzcA family heavy metal efflux pump